MNYSNTDGRTYSPGETGHTGGAVAQKVRSPGLDLTPTRNIASNFFGWFEKYLIVFVVGGFFAGIGIASRKKSVSNGY